MKANRIVPKQKGTRLEEAYVELNILQQQIDHVQKYLEYAEEQLRNINNTIAAIATFAKQKKGTPAKAPLANGIFFSCNIEDTKHLFVNVGNDIVVKKTPQECISLFTAHKEELEQTTQEAFAQLSKLIQKMEDVKAKIKANPPA
ncbi:prefoldin subunit alpha [Candidatus Woesearchaeota archaeon]|nr:MAG: prefoldin subunit alpha [Candidatus Woesearchaeota archaeon]